MVCWSGGPDSTALLLWLWSIAKDRNWRILPFHVEHDSTHSGEAKDWVEGKAAAWGLPLKVVKGGNEGEGGRGPEERWRLARYAAIERTLSLEGFEFAAMGHTLDDSVETLLLRMGRSAGIEGLKGIPLRRGPIVRPLLETTREDVMCYLAEKGVDAWVDPTNSDPHQPRARLREVMPALKRAWGDRWPKGPLQSLKHLGMDSEALGEVAIEMLKHHKKDKRLSLRVLDLPRGLAARTIRMWLYSLGSEAPQGGLHRLLGWERGKSGSVEGPPSFRVEMDGEWMEWKGTPRE